MREVIRATIARWANEGRIQPPVGDFWASDIDKMTQEIIDALGTNDLVKHLALDLMEKAKAK